jgi:5,10-methylenetetrahydromethanopterin reductase
MPSLEAGLQVHLPTFPGTTVPQLVDLGRAAQAAGIGQIWVTDNLQSRNAFVVLTALASALKLRLGTGIMVQYFRSPIDVADSVAALSELMDGRELSIGVARGNVYTKRFVNVVKPLAVLRETAQCLSALLGGRAIEAKDYPELTAYFNFAPEATFKLSFLPKAPVKLYGGGNGPKALAIAGEHLDGVLFGGTLQAAAATGRLAPLLKIADDAAAAKGRPAPGKVAEVKISIHRDGRKARDFVKHAVASRIVNLRPNGYSDDDYRRMGVDPATIDRLIGVLQGRRPTKESDPYVTDEMIDALYIAGDPGYVRERMTDTCRLAREHGFRQLMFSEIGPDMAESLPLLGEAVLPLL